MTRLSGNSSTEQHPTVLRALYVGLKRFWREGAAIIAFYCAGLAAGAFWIYSEMPMICH